MVDTVTHTIRKRIKIMMGYPEFAGLQDDENDLYRVTYGLDHYGLGTVRSPEAYLKFAEVDIEKKTCGPMKWCSEGVIE